ncbi:metal-binding protein [Solibacillus sp. R5-41]|uniref:metal-binding protein n=1 Tax=Solibacillus sp. R5-41 TaxID=2048654 RepID=UPI000C127E40|nr:metal-binding protein [Solibacillus sp. R5-41]ATP40750.1 metal-binding protein [Solibacillus sp. R5-41]
MYKDNEKSAENRKKTFTLFGADMHPYRSDTPGIFGGYRPSKLYGRLDCPSALRAIAKGGYVKHRVFYHGQAEVVKRVFALKQVYN